MFREKNTLHSSLRILSHLWNTVVVVSWLGPGLLLLARTACHHWWNNEFWILPAKSKDKRQDICLRTESQENLGHAARQQPQAHKSFYQRMVKEEQS